MSAPIIQSEYERLEQVAQRFDSEHQRLQRLTNLVNQRIATLKGGGWIATAATQFYDEYDQEIAPALGRLSSALQEASKTSREIVRILKEAEEEAASHLRGEGAGAGGGEGNPFMLASYRQQAGDGRAEDLTDRFRDRLNQPDQAGAPPVMAGVAGALPLAGGAALADGPLPIGDVIALGILGAAVIGGLWMASSSSDQPAANPNVDQDKVDNVLGESEAATGNVTSGEALNDDEALEALDQWLGDDVEEIAPGVFRSKNPNPDGTYNQGRIDNNSLEGNHPPNVPHVHLERVRPGQVPGRWDNVSNNHIPLE